jgi:hypothetical protein
MSTFAPARSEGVLSAGCIHDCLSTLGEAAPNQWLKEAGFQLVGKGPMSAFFFWALTLVVVVERVRVPPLRWQVIVSSKKKPLTRTSAASVDRKTIFKSAEPSISTKVGLEPEKKYFRRHSSTSFRVLFVTKSPEHRIVVVAA